MISSEQLQPCSCPICLKDIHKLVYNIKGFNIVRCTSCSMVYVNPRLKDEEIYAIYKKNYFIKDDYTFKDFGYGNYELTGRLRDKTFNYWYDDFILYLNAKGISAFDIGCATGRFLNILSKNSFNVKGIELDERMCNELIKQGHDVKNIPIELFDTTEKFDLITMFDVIEHIPHLHKAISNIHSMLSDIGSLVIVTPNVASFQKKILGKRWFHFKPWEHISYFSPRTIKHLANMFGFKIVYFSTSYGQYADLSFIHHRLLRYGFNFAASVVENILKLPGLKNRSLYIPTGSMLVILNKK